MWDVGQLHISHNDETWHSYTLPKEDTKIYKSSDLVSLRIWSHLLKKSLMENLIFCAVFFLILLNFIQSLKLLQNLLL